MCDHQEVGAELLKSWLIPEEIYEPIRQHHRENAVAEAYRKSTSLLSIADNISSFYTGAQDVDKIRQVKHILLEEFGVQGAAVDALIESIAIKSFELFSVFEIDPGNLQPFSRILQEANKELCKLHDSYELQVIELKQAQKKLKKQAKELKETNAKLRELASQDGLTGVFNHRFFQEAMDREIFRSQRYGRGFSLVLFDVDDLKTINDTFGHPVGDLVLVEICKAVRKIIRVSDTLARYGGDEFAVIMPETKDDRASIFAEHLRQCVEGLNIQLDNEIIKAKISIGLSSYDPANKLMDKTRVILLADKALLQVKKSGKNRILSL